MKNLFISTTFARDNSKVSDTLILCKKNGINNIELGSNHSYEKDYNKILKKLNFSYLVHNYFPIPKNSFVVNIASTKKNIRNKSVEHAYKAIKLSKKIKAKLYTIHPGFIVDPKSSSKNKKNYDFIWSQKNYKYNYSYAFDLMVSSLKKIVKFAKKNKVKIAIESEGSIKKKKFLLMQEPREYNELFKHFKPSELGVNLNIGHLNLSSKAFKFCKYNFVEKIKPYILAMELSHNNGLEDQHLPLKKNAWYWKIINDPELNRVHKILEFRNSNVKKIDESIKLFKSIKK